MPKIAAPLRIEKEEFWLDHLKRWRRENMSLAGYARSVNLKVSRLYVWKARLESRGLWNDPDPVSFLPVTVVGSPAPAGLRLMLRNGVALEFNQPLDEALLPRLLEIAGRLP